MQQPEECNAKQNIRSNRKYLHVECKKGSNEKESACEENTYMGGIDSLLQPNTADRELHLTQRVARDVWGGEE